jgi:DNA invertase Pin-like site-specific DNA recombinase
MPTEVRAAAIYARISSDQEGTALGVGRQVEDCRRLAASQGWRVAEEYVDNDLSAYSGKNRPSYQRLLADLRDGYRDGVIVYHVDRLTRRPIELEEFLAAVDAARVRQVRFVSGDMDLGTGDGLMMARIMGAVAANESASKSRRVKRKLDDVAAAGRPHGGQRPFGYDADMVTVRPDEAAVIRQLVERRLAGESWRSLTNWLTDEQVPTVSGKPWRTTSVQGLVTSARIAGLRQHRGEVVGPAVWPAIIDPAQRDKVLAKQAADIATGRRTPRRYLLSGLCRCGRCGGKLYAAARQASRRYVCLAGPDHGGCGRLTVVADPLERLVADLVLFRLDTPELGDALAGRVAADEQAAGLSEKLAADKDQLDELAGMFAGKQITSREWLTARGPIEARISDTERRLPQRTSTDALTGWTGNGDALREQWSSLNLTRQAAIVAAVLDRVVISPGQLGARSLDPERVQPVWRL